MASVTTGETEAAILDAQSKLAAAISNSALRGDPLQDVLRAQGAVVDVQRGLATMMRAMMEGQRPKLTERELHEITEIARMSAGMVVAQRDRSRARFLAAVFGILALVAVAGAGFAGYSMRSERCAVLETWASAWTQSVKR
ncbi:MAG: hypothetical protein ACRYG8_20255 [Janthinobacterium lividum]